MATARAAFLYLVFLVHWAVSSYGSNSSVIELGASISLDGSQSTWLSQSRYFAFGFYQQGNGYAIGIWLIGRKQNTTVWTANRDDPPVGSSSTLELSKDGLSLQTGKKTKKLTDDLTAPASSATMLDTGNFVIYDETFIVIWQSFDHPTDTILGSQNLTRGNQLFSSESDSGRSTGRLRLILHDDCNVVTYPRFNTDPYWVANTITEADSCNLTLSVTGTLGVRTPEIFKEISNSSTSTGNETVIYRATIDANGNFGLYAHHLANDSINQEWSALTNNLCTVRGICGFNSFCTPVNMSYAYCTCFPGFKFIDSRDQFGGCYRSFKDNEACLDESPTEHYNMTRLSSIDVDTKYAYTVVKMHIKDCPKMCLEDCICDASSYIGQVCHGFKLPLLYGNITNITTTFIKIKKFQTSLPPARSVPPAPVVTQFQDRTKILHTLVASLGSLTFICAVIAISSFLLYRRRVHVYKRLSEFTDFDANQDLTLRSFGYSELERATDGFKEVLGRGSLGTVYKGLTSEGRLVAVKRLEKPVEGETEFRTVMAAIRRVRHRNLVRLIGFCVETARRLLVYEYMSNGSLADMLFISERQPVWKERVRVALDIARGILYLHEECEGQIIHCNIKPRNILIDASGTAKVSDLGLSKLLLPNQTGALAKVRGSGGYLAPECQKNALITTKADVYSFGVVLLEIVCCRGHMEINVSSPDEVLLSSWIYNCYTSGQLDKLVQEEVNMKTLERMVKIGLLCIQDDPDMRPSMKNVMLMLEGIMDVPVPPSPAPSKEMS